MTSIRRMYNARFLTALLLYPLLLALHADALASNDDRFGKALGEEGLSGAVWSTLTPERASNPAQRESNTPPPASA